MGAVSSIAATIGALGLLFAAINLIYPIKRLGIATRKRAAVVLVASFGLSIVGGALSDPDKQPEQGNRQAVTMQDSSARVEQRTESEAHKTASDVGVLDQSGSSESGVVSNRFVLQWSLDGTNLSLAIDTDLPDTAEVIVSVDRTYYTAGRSEAYSRSYFSERGRISKWRTPRLVPINDEVWKADLKAHQTKMARISRDVAFEIDRIEDQIEVRAVVHLNQPDPSFGGHGSPKLSGRAVSRMAGRNNRNIVEDEKEIELPLTGTRPTKRVRNVPYDGLRKGETYRLLTKTPLISARHNSNSISTLEEAMKVLSEMLYIPPGRVIRVVGVARSNGPNPWYEVEVIGDDWVRGWINSTALIRDGVVLE